jgi:hypothetical protein
MIIHSLVSSKENKNYNYLIGSLNYPVSKDESDEIVLG